MERDVRWGGEPWITDIGLKIKEDMDMADRNITIGFPEEKLNVLLFFLNREQQNLETLLMEQLEKLYTRTVPKPTRDFIQFQMTGEVTPDVEEPQETAAVDKESKKAQKRGKKQEQQADMGPIRQEGTPPGTSVQEESGGMQMGM